MASLLSITRVAQIFGVGAAAWLAGNIMGLSLVAVPALQQSREHDGVTAGSIVQQWRHIYNIGAFQNPIIAVTGALAFTYLAWTSQAPVNTNSFIIAALSTVAIAPFTQIMMSTTNRRLHGYADAAIVDMKAGGVSTDGDIEQLIKKWARLNMIRGLFPLTAFVVGMLALI